MRRASSRGCRGHAQHRYDEVMAASSGEAARMLARNPRACNRRGISCGLVSKSQVQRTLGVTNSAAVSCLKRVTG